ncbi:hypothetical protein T459_30870 [Capsicum annuum]|uniref:Uncharacterized protein n=1 Tax=Capsicum annuum TaxID=4072 RepID=A0A2G2Y9K9_CAPAN|nr:hypothetical protein T459_30870 [Capsicum annuum]
MSLMKAQNWVNGLSTEQQKRLNIAVELVANPSIIFVDEPTSGLNARAAAIVMRTVRNTIDTGRTVVCTIHQPSINIFEAFDESMPGVSKVKDGYNPATWMLEVTTSAQEMMLGVDFADLYKQSDLYRRKKTLSVSYGVIVYAMIRFEWTASKFFWYLFIMYFTLLYFTFYGMMTVAVPQMKLFLKLPSTFSVAYGIFSQDSSFHDQVKSLSKSVALLTSYEFQLGIVTDFIYKIVHVSYLASLTRYRKMFMGQVYQKG